MSIRDSIEWKELEGIANRKYRWSSLVQSLVAAPASSRGRDLLGGRQKFTEIRQFYLLGIIAGRTATQIVHERQKAEKLRNPLSKQRVHKELSIIEKFLFAIVPEAVASSNLSRFNQADRLRHLLENTEYLRATNQEAIKRENDLASFNDLILDFVGREKELEELKSKIEAGARLIHIYGRLGNGKSYLARKLVQDLKQNLNYELCYIKLRHELSFKRFSDKILRYSTDTNNYQLIADREGDKLEEIIRLLREDHKVCILVDDLDGLLNEIGTDFKGDDRELYRDFFRSISISPIKCIVITTSRDVDVFRRSSSHAYKKELDSFCKEDCFEFLKSLKVQDEAYFSEIYNLHAGNPLLTKALVDCVISPNLEMSAKKFAEKYRPDTCCRDIEDYINTFCQQRSENELRVMSFIANENCAVSIEEVIDTCKVAQPCVDTLLKLGKKSIFKLEQRDGQRLIQYSCVFYQEKIRKVIHQFLSN